MRIKISVPRPILAMVLLPFLYGCDNQATPENSVEKKNWEKTDDGLIVQLKNSEFKRLRLQVIDDDIIRVSASPQSNFNNLPDTFMIVDQNHSAEFSIEQNDEYVSVKTAEVSAKISLDNGHVKFFDKQGSLLLSEANRSLSQVTQDPGKVDDDSFSFRQQFVRDKDEAYYGLGQQQDGRVNYAGENIELTTFNLEIAIPYLVSSKNYGLLWNNTGITRLGDPEPPKPLSNAFTLYDTEGNIGGLSARFYDGDELKVSKTMTDLNYQFLAQGSTREVPMPDEVKDAKNLRIEWEGSIEAKKSGKHELKMYSSGYAKLWLNGELIQDRWRMNWNPWYHNSEVELTVGQRYPLKLDWLTQGGYFRLLQHAPRPENESKHLSISTDTGKAIDYYFVAGDNKDELIAGYRQLTGEATMLPKWAFGFWQSRERYKNQEELLSALEEYRERKIPIDNIVLDWSYWPEDAWGSHDFDKKYFPDAKAMVDRVHELNANIMISVWPKYYPTTENYQALNAKGCMFNKNIEEKNLDWIGAGYLNGFYDAYNPECRELYWQQIRDKLNVLGFDAWWLDAVEPDIHSNLSFKHRKDLMTPNALGTGAEVFNAYALPHAETVYQGERKTDKDKRSFILTRSGFGGIQRTGSAIWSGDVVSRWSNLKEQIAAGIGVGLAGVPYWTFDIGGFTPEDHYRSKEGKFVGHFSQMAEEYQQEWQELNLRWFQFGAFVPIFRSHGQNPYREIYNLADNDSDTYKSLVWYTQLRYRLMPYIYTLAGDASHKQSTMMRGLVMDFADDPSVQNINTQYMFGPSLLVNPIYENGARSRPVYLPAGANWYNFDSGDLHQGGQTIDAKAPLTRMPLFVKAGSIIPTGPDIQHTGESLNADLTLNVYTGADGDFEIYEDDGLSYGYEKGQWSRIPLHYNDKTKTLTIDKRKGSFEGMATQRNIHVRWITPGQSATNFAATPDHSLVYDGQAKTLTFEGIEKHSP